MIKFHLFLSIPTKVPAWMDLPNLQETDTLFLVLIIPEKKKEGKEEKEGREQGRKREESGREEGRRREVVPSHEVHIISTVQEGKSPRQSCLFPVFSELATNIWAFESWENDSKG